MDGAQPDVVVVGGGIAGITAALAVAQRGLKVALLEKGVRLGGRARSWRDPKTQDPVPIGPHMFLDLYPSLWKLLELLGTRDKIVWQKDPNLFMTWVQGQKETEVRFAPALPAPISHSPTLLNMIRDFPDISQADVQANVAVTIYALRLSEEELLEIDDESCISLLRRFNVTEAFIHHFWAFVSHAIFNVPIEELSACAMLRFYRVLVGSSRLQIGFSGVGLGELFEPAEQVLRDLGVDVRLRTEVVSLEGSSESCSGATLETGEVLRPRVGVLVTLPAYQLPALLREEWLARPSVAAAARLRPCAYVCVYFWFDRKLTDRMFWARAFEEESLTCDWYDFSNIYEGWEGRPSFIGTNLIDTDARPAGRLSDDEISQGALDELCEYLPAARDAHLIHSKVQRVPCAIHRPVVGAERARLPPGPFAGVERLFLAGDWTATELPDCMDSAANSGWLAAESLLLAAGGQGIAVGSAEGLRPEPWAPDLSARLIGLADVFRPLNVWLAGLRGGAPAARNHSKL